MKKLIIDRNFWRRNLLGADIEESALLIEDQLCCLGFYCRDIGKIPEKDLMCRGFPSDIGINIFRDVAMEELQYSLEKYLTAINDRNETYRFISNGEQERLIAEGFKIVNIEVEFIN